MPLPPELQPCRCSCCRRRPARGEPERQRRARRAERAPASACFSNSSHPPDRSIHLVTRLLSRDCPLAQVRALSFALMQPPSAATACEAIRLVHHERQGAEHLGALAEHAGDDLDLVGGARDRVAPRRPRAAASSRTSPATARSPPTITHSGLSRLQRFATAIPIARPASPISRWAAASPEAESSSSRRVETSSPRLALEQVGDRPGRGKRLEAAAVAAAADRAALGDQRVADLARRPADPVLEPAAGDQPGADARTRP